MAFANSGAAQNYTNVNAAGDLANGHGSGFGDKADQGWVFARRWRRGKRCKSAMKKHTAELGGVQLQCPAASCSVTGGDAALGCPRPCASAVSSDIHDCNGTWAISFADSCAAKPANSAGFNTQRQGRLRAIKAPTSRAPKTNGTGWRVAKGLATAFAASYAIALAAFKGYLVHHALSA